MDKHRIVDLAGDARSSLLLAWVHHAGRDSVRLMTVRQAGHYAVAEALSITPSELDAVAFPKISARGNVGFAVGTAMVDGRHGVWACHVSAQRHHFEMLPQSESGVDPAVGFIDGKRCYVAWTRLEASGAKIVLGLWEPGLRFSIRKVFAMPRTSCFRPDLATGRDGRGWLVCDGYDAMHGYAIYGARIGPRGDPELRLLAQDRWWLRSPVMLADGPPAYVAWLNQRDVTDSFGAVDMHHTIDVCRLEHGACQDRRTVADLSHGLLPQVLPTRCPGWGFRGHRRKFYLISEQGQPALYWERKAVPDQKTEGAEGQLCRRILETAGWSQARETHRGHSLYTPCGMSGGRVRWAAVPLHARNTVIVADAAAKREGQGSVISFGTTAGWFPFEKGGSYNPTATRPCWELGSRRWKLFWFDLHVHGKLSGDSEGDRDEQIHYARDKGELDGVVLQENDLAMANGQLRTGDLWADWGTRAGEFIVFPGWEWTAQLMEGPDHRTVIFKKTPTEIARCSDANGDLRPLVEVAERNGAILHAHHREWKLSPSLEDANIEVCSMWGDHMRRPDHVHAALAGGRKVGFIGGSDGHRITAGVAGALTGIWAETLDREKVFQALRAHRTFATAGGRCVVQAWIGECPMGSRTQGKQDPIIRLRVLSKTPVAEVRLVRDGCVVCRWSDLDDTTYFPVDLQLDFTDARLAGGEHYYYWGIRLAVPETTYPGNMVQAVRPGVYTSPIWYAKAPSRNRYKK